MTQAVISSAKVFRVSQDIFFSDISMAGNNERQAWGGEQPGYQNRGALQGHEYGGVAKMA